MTRSWIGALLIAATALTPIAASAQDGGFGTRIVRDAQRGGGERATRDPDRSERAQPRQQQRAEAPAPQRVQYQRGDGRRGGGDGGQRRSGGDGANRRSTDGNGNGGWQGRSRDRSAPAPAPAPVQTRQGRTGGGDGARWQGRNGGGQGSQSGQWQGRRDGGQATAQRGTQRGEWQGRRDGGADRNGSYDRNRDGNRGGNDGRRYDGRRGDDGFGSRVVRDAQRGGYDRNDRDGRYDRDGRDGRDGRYDGRRWDNDRRDNRYGRGDNGRRWNHSWRNDRRYDWRGHRQRYGQTYRLGRYYSPYRNYSYRSLSVGFFLDSLFYSNRYWINDPYNYRLPDVYGPYRWVRYYDDALLVDVETGEVVDVINNFFW